MGSNPSGRAKQKRHPRGGVFVWHILEGFEPGAVVNEAPCGEQSRAMPVIAQSRTLSERAVGPDRAADSSECVRTPTGAIRSTFQCRVLFRPFRRLAVELLVQLRLIVVDVVEDGVEQAEQGAGEVRAHLHPVDHGEAPEGGHVGDDVVDVSEVGAVRIQGGQIPPHPLPVQRRALERAHAPEGVQIRLYAEVVVQVLTAETGDAGAKGPAQDLRCRLRVRLVELCPL